MAEHILHSFERKIVRRIYGPIQEKGTGTVDETVQFVVFANHG